MSDKDKVLQICTRIDRALQRDWGSSGKSLADKLKTSKFRIPPQLVKRIRYLSDLERKAAKKANFRLKSGDDFLRKGEQVLDELQAARLSARRRLGPWAAELVQKHRVVAALLALALLAVPVLGYVLLTPPPEPEFPPLPQMRKVAPKAALAPATPSPAPAPAASSANQAEGPVPVASQATSVIAEPQAPAADPDAPPADIAPGTQVAIEAPPGVAITVKRIETPRTPSDRQEITVIVDVQNLGYETLKRISFDAWLYDLSGKKAVAVISPSGSVAASTPWYAFLRQSMKRGQGAEVRLSYQTGSAWSSEKVIETVKSGRYLIRLSVVTLTDGQDKTLRF